MGDLVGAGLVVAERRVHVLAGRERSHAGELVDGAQLRGVVVEEQAVAAIVGDVQQLADARKVPLGPRAVPLDCGASARTRSVADLEMLRRQDALVRLLGAGSRRRRGPQDHGESESDLATHQRYRTVLSRATPAHRWQR